MLTAAALVALPFLSPPVQTPRITEVIPLH